VLAAIATEARKFLAKHREQLDNDQRALLARVAEYHVAPPT